MAELASSSIQQKTTNPDTPNDSDNQELNALTEKWSNLSFEMSQISELLKEIKSNDRLLQHHGLIGIKMLVSNKDGSPPIQEVIDAGIVPRLIEFMQNDTDVHLQAEAARIVANLLSGTAEQTKAIIDLGALPVLMKLLKSPLPEILKEAIFALGNIAGDNTIYRDAILNQGGLELLINIISTAQDLTLIKDTTFAISNLCKGKPKTNLVSKAIPVMCAVIKKETNPTTLLDALCALGHLSEPTTNIQAVIATGVAPSLLNHLRSADQKVVTQCLRVLGNIITGDDQQTEFVISFRDFLPQLFKLAQDPSKPLRREACWIVSNITAGSPDQINIIMKNPEYVRILIHTATNDDLEVQKEAIWALSNAVVDGNSLKFAQATRTDIFNCLNSHLDCNDAKLLLAVLEGLANLLETGNAVAQSNNSGQNEFVLRLEETGGLEKLEGLQTHPDTEVYNKVSRILENYFVLDDEPL